MILTWLKNIVINVFKAIKHIWRNHIRMKKEKEYKKQTLSVVEKRDLSLMRADIVRLEAMLIQGCISRKEYNKELEEISNKVAALEEKYGIR